MKGKARGWICWRYRNVPYSTGTAIPVQVCTGTAITVQFCTGKAVPVQDYTVKYTYTGLDR